MKYEAKNNGSGVAVSQAAGNPYVDLTIGASKTKCTNIGAKYDLISNPEWMTIARNAESVSSNWSSGSIGYGVMARGWTGNTALGDIWTNTVAASSTGPECKYNTAANSCASTGNHLYRRTLALSNGEEIWDFSGNVSEWVDWSHTTAGLQLGPTTCANSWVEFPAVTSDSCYTGGAILSHQVFPATTGGSSVEALGRFHGGEGGAALRGGDWSEGSTAGAFSLDLVLHTTDSYTGGGFRCVYRP
jgi:hypothetical protein